MNSTFALIALSLTTLSAAPAVAQEKAPSSRQNFTVIIEGEDAEALFVRLQKKEYAGDGLDRMITKIGQNVLCTREKINKSPLVSKYDYKCALSFHIESGELHEMYPIGEDDKDAGLKDDEKGYQGTSVNVKAGGGEAIFTIHGLRAQELYDGMSKIKEEDARIQDGKFSEVPADEKRDGNQQGTTVKVKKGLHVTCFRSTFTLTPVTECTITLTPASGKATPSGEGGMNEKKADEEEPAQNNGDPAQNSNDPAENPAAPSPQDTNPQDGGSGAPSVTPENGGDGSESPNPENPDRPKSP